MQLSGMCMELVVRVFAVPWHPRAGRVIRICQVCARGKSVIEPFVALPAAHQRVGGGFAWHGLEVV